MLSYLLRRIDVRSGLREFLESLEKTERLLDVGCAGGSPRRIKEILPSTDYHGVDILDECAFAEDLQLMKKYNQAMPENFADGIRQIEANEFDVIVSSHNLEHCLKPLDVLSAMNSKLATGDSMYISTPRLESVNFPLRTGH